MSQGFTKGVPIDTDVTLSTNSNLLVPSQYAIKTYVDTADATLQTNINAKQNQITATTTADYYRGDKTMQPVSGLPVSTAQQTALDLKQNSSLSPLRIKGRWHIPSEIGFTLATGSLVLNNIYALAVRFTEPTTITDIGFIATSGIPLALANIGIYDSNSLGEPNNLVASASNINITSSGTKSVTLGSPVVLPVGKYWFAIISSATISVTSSGVSALSGIGNATLVATTVTAILKGLTFTSLPNPFGAYTTTNQANVPFVWFKTS
jgi:hypothetical protein